MHFKLYGSILGFIALLAQPALAMKVRTTLLFTPGVEFSQQNAVGPVSASAKALKEKLEAYKGNYASELATFYALNDYRSMWISEARWSARAKDMIKRLSDSQYDGLEPKEYLKTIFFTLDTGNSEKPDEKLQAEAEVELSLSAINFLRHLSSGRIDPARAGVFARPEVIPARQILQDLSGTADIQALVAKYEPQHAGYRALRAALGVALSEKKHFSEKPFIASGPVLSEGMKDERVPLLRKRLALNAYSDAPAVMDADLVEAVRNFQEDNDLKATGALNKSTVRALNEKAEVKGKNRISVPDLIVNMERWRWLPHELGETNVVVNIPEFLVRVSKGGETTFEGRVVVGKQSTPTPVFSNKIQYIVVNPSWNIPPSIVRNEMLPMLQEDPEAFMRRGYEVRQDERGHLSFRQPPSARNALGRIKFMFPNDHDVYLHDTPAKGYFDRSMRAFSHGCVRVDRPLRFADALLVNESKLNGKTLGRMFGDEERFLNLQKFIPIHIVYFTAVADKNGEIERHEDIYGLDARLKFLLELGKHV
jgi:murein L,D-transpeptidase YcbB/YkuD